MSSLIQQGLLILKRKTQPFEKAHLFKSSLPLVKKIVGAELSDTAKIKKA